MRNPLRTVPLVAFVLSLGAVAVSGDQKASPHSDLDEFMAQVLARRDENWSKLQQYVLDERERAEVTGPAQTRLYGSTGNTPGTSATAPSSAAPSGSTVSP